jgi:hypothetical protein
MDERAPADMKAALGLLEHYGTKSEGANYHLLR